MDDRKNIKLIIDNYFKKLIQPVSGKEYIRLEQNIVSTGYAEPVTV